MHFGPADKIVDILGVHDDAPSLTVRDLPRDLAAELPDFPLQLAHTGLTRVTRDELAQRVVRDCELLRRETVLAQLARDEIPLGDLQLLALGVACEVHGLQPVEQRPGDGLEEVRRRDEQDFRQVERHAEVVVGERVVLGRIQHLEQRGGGVALEGNPELVYLV